jgi:IS5 family transposase
MKKAALNSYYSVKKTRKQVFLEQMDQLMTWVALVEQIASYYPERRTDQPLFSLSTILRIHFMQQWFMLSDLGMEEAFFAAPLYREFAQLEAFSRLPDESINLRFLHRLAKHKLAEQILATVNELLPKRGLLIKAGTAVDANLIAAPTSNKNKDRARDPEMHSSKKGNQWYFCMNAHIGVDTESGLVHTVHGTSGHVSDIAEANTLLHGQVRVAFGDAGYQGIEKRPDAKADVSWHVAMRPGKRKALNKENEADAMVEKAEKLKARIQAKVEYRFRVVKRQFGFVKVRYCVLKKNTTQLFTLFALSNFWMVRAKLIGAAA